MIPYKATKYEKTDLGFVMLDRFSCFGFVTAMGVQDWTIS